MKTVFWKYGTHFLLQLCGAVAFAAVQKETVLFQKSATVPTGHALFLTGNIPELGDNDTLQAIRMYPPPSGSTTWQVKVSLPTNLTYEYHYFSRDPHATSDALGFPFLDVTGNPPVAVGSTISASTSSTALIPPSKTLFLTTQLTSPKLWWRQGSGAYTSVSMQYYTAGRPATGGGQESIWFAWNIGTTAGAAGRSVEFYFTDGANNNRIPSAPGTYNTPLDTCFVQDHNIYNYMPSATVGVANFNTGSDCVTTCCSQAGCGPSCTYSGPHLVPSSPILDDEDVRYRVFLPRGYSEHTSRRYPVVYIFDGQEAFARPQCNGTYRGWLVDRRVAELVNQGKTRECILVAVYSSFALSTHNPSVSFRTRDYSLSRNALDFADFICDELKPIIDTLRTQSGPSSTVAIGTSHSALFAEILGWYRYDTFGNVGCLSVPLDDLEGSWAPSSLFDTSQSPPVRTYFSTGTGAFEIRNLRDDPPQGRIGMHQVVSALVSKQPIRYTLGKDIEYDLVIGAGHDETAWGNRMPSVFDFLLPISEERNYIFTDVFNWAYDINSDGVVDELDIAAINATPILPADLNFDGTLNDYRDKYLLTHFVRRNCLPDLNLDGVVDDADFSLFVLAYDLVHCSDSSMAAGCQADFNRDDLVNDADFSIYATYYDAITCP